MHTVHTYIDTYTHRYIDTYTHRYIDTYTHRYIDTYIRTHTQTLQGSGQDEEHSSKCEICGLSEKYIDNNIEVYNNFTDYKKALDRVWHDGLWTALEKHGINTNIISCLKNLQENTENAVRVDANLSYFFKCSVGLRQGCVLSPILSNEFLEELVSRATDQFDGGIFIQGKQLSNLRFANDIALLTPSVSSLKDLATRLNKTSKKLGMEISAEKSKLLVVGATTERIDEIVQASGTSLQQFKYLGCTIHQNGKSSAEVFTRVGMAKAAMTKLSTIWMSVQKIFLVKLRLLRSMVISMLLYGCETWTYNERIEKKVNACEMWCYRRMLGIKWTDERTNESTRQQVANMVGSTQRGILETAKERKMRLFGHVR